MNRFARVCSLGLLTSIAVLVGAPHAVAGLVTVPDDTLLPTDGQTDDQFGYAVAVEQDLAVVGAWGHSLVAPTGGAAYVSRRDANGWGFEDKLVPSVAQDDHRFGISVAIAGTDVLVGAHHDATEAWASGAVFVFAHDGTSWQEEQKLTPGDGVFDGRFGISMAASGNTSVFGSLSGAAYVYVTDGTSWAVQQKLTSSTVGENERFGVKVAIDGDVVVLGAPLETTADGEEGAAYVMTRSGTTWSEAQRLVAWSGGAYDNFGDSVAVDGDTLFVGAPYDDEGGSDAGAVYVFKLDAGVWTQDDKLIPAGIAAGDAFGTSVALRGDAGIVGSPFDDDTAAFAGSAILYQRIAGAWTERTKVLSPTGGADDSFGTSVATDGSTALAGSPGDDGVEQDVGMAFAFLLRLENGDPCNDAASCASGYCVDGVCCETDCDGGATVSCSACSAATGSTADGVCGFATSSTACADAICSGPTEVQPASTCDGQGACQAPAVTACNAGYTCADGACLDTCSSLDDCADGYRCAGDSTCVELLDLGVACVEANACESGFCVDSICCNEACEDGVCSTGTCEAVESDGGAPPGAGGSAGSGGSGGAPSSPAQASEEDDGGCGCATVGTSRTVGPVAWLLLLGAFFGLRRRR